MKRIVSLLLAAVFVCAMSISVSAIKTEYSIPTATLNNILSDYRSALKNGDKYVSLSQYGVSGSDAYRDLYELVIQINGDLGSLTYGKYSETILTSVIDYNSSTGSISGITITYQERYRKDDGSCDINLVKEDQKLITDRFNAAKAVAKKGMNDVEKALALHDYIITAVNYPVPIGKDADGEDEYKPEEYTVAGLLRDGSAVCAAYAKLYAILLNESGVPAVTVDSDSIDHEWVMAKINGDWYHIDVTWDDFFLTDDYTALWDFNNDNWDIGAVDHYYFLKSDEEFIELDHPDDWEISYNVNPDMLDEPPKAEKSGAFDDMFFSDKNETFYSYSRMNYINGTWYFTDLNTFALVRTVYGGEPEVIELPDNAAAKYCFAYGDDLYISSNDFLFRFDTISEKFYKIMKIPDDRAELENFSEMRILNDELTLVKAIYTYGSDEEYPESAEFEVLTYPMSEVVLMEPIIDSDSDEETETVTRGDTSDTASLNISRPGKTDNAPQLSAEDKEMLENAETAGKRAAAFVYLGIAAIFVIFAVIAIVLAIKYSKKK